jgi:adenylate kinase
MTVFFVAGVHGVGKTTACSEVANRLSIGHYTASKLIREERASAISTSSKVVADLQANQQLLVAGVHRLLDTGKRFLLDGHFTLLTSSGIEPIPIRVFEHLRLAGIVLFSDFPEAIVARALERDGTASSVEVVHQHQELECAHAKDVALACNIPLFSLNAFDVTGLENAVRDWFANASVK